MGSSLKYKTTLSIVERSDDKDIQILLEPACKTFPNVHSITGQQLWGVEGWIKSSHSMYLSAQSWGILLL